MDSELEKYLKPALQWLDRRLADQKMKGDENRAEKRRKEKRRDMKCVDKERREEKR